MGLLLIFFGCCRCRRKDFLVEDFDQRSGDPFLDLLFPFNRLSSGFGEPLTKPFNAAGGVQQFLLSGEKRMTGGTHIHFNGG